jgi:hypothetical protein
LRKTTISQGGFTMTKVTIKHSFVNSQYNASLEFLKEVTQLKLPEHLMLEMSVEKVCSLRR